MGNVVSLRRSVLEDAGETASPIAIPEDEIQALTLRTTCAFAVLTIGFGLTLTMPAVLAFVAFILFT